MIDAGELLPVLKLVVRSAAFCGWAHVELTLHKDYPAKPLFSSVLDNVLW